jgi:hypothetical protein
LLSEFFDVSIQTIRLDRMELGISELRERIRSVAEGTYSKLRSIAGKEIVGNWSTWNRAGAAYQYLKQGMRCPLRKPIS